MVEGASMFRRGLRGPSLSARRLCSWAFLSLMVSLSACWSGSPTESPVPSVGPSSIPSPTPEPPPWTLNADALPRCSATDLRAVIDEGEGAGGWRWEYLKVHIGSPAPCAVSSHPSLELRDSKGRTIAASDGGSPFIGWRAEHDWQPVGSEPGENRPGRVRRLLHAAISQGTCPGGVFPGGSVLVLNIPETGGVEIERFQGSLVHGYRCDEAQEPPSGTPELLITDLISPLEIEKQVTLRR